MPQPKLRWAMAATAAMLAASPAVAQDMVVLNPTTLVNTAGIGAATQQIRNNMSRQSAPSAPRRAVSASSFAFRPDAAAQRQVHARAVAQMKRSSPGDAAKLSQMLSSGQLRRDVAGYLGRYGMSVNNVADTTAFYLANAWLATRGSSADPTRAQMTGLRNQVASTFASIPAFASASNATKQDLSEANIVQAALCGTIANAAATTPGLLAKARPAVAKGVRDLYGLDILTMQLTDRGLR